GQTIDWRSDIFSVGVHLWELLCGRKLFTGDSDLALLEKVRRAEVPPPRSLNAEVPEALDAVVLKALAADRDQRYQWCSELHDDLVRFAVAGETLFGSRRLGEWMREEFSAEYESEQARMWQWQAIRIAAPAPSAVPGRAATTIPAVADPGVARAVVRDTPEWRLVADTAESRLVADRDTFVDATSGTAAHPTIVLRPGEARVPIFDNSTEQTAARRSDRVGALTRPVPRRSQFRKLVLAGAPLAVAAVAGLGYLVLQFGETAPSRPVATKKPLPQEAPPPIAVAETSAAPIPSRADTTSAS